MTNQNTFIVSLHRAIQSLKKHETSTKDLLSTLSRSILSLHLPVDASSLVNAHGTSCHDVGVVNRLLTVLSPANKRVARLFFQAFLPYTFDATTDTFGKLLKKDNARDNKYIAIGSFLHEEENDIWSWQAEHINMEAKPVNYAAEVTKAVTKAMKEDKGAMSAKDVLSAVFAAGIDLQDAIAILYDLNTSETVAKVA